jgi:hypothetical protein
MWLCLFMLIPVLCFFMFYVIYIFSLICCLLIVAMSGIGEYATLGWIKGLWGLGQQPIVSILKPKPECAEPEILVVQLETGVTQTLKS